MDERKKEKKKTRLVDLHVHIGPEPIERKYRARELSILAARESAIFGTKNHFFPTAYLTEGLPGLVGSIVLNESVGGLNPSAVYSAASVFRDPIIVWMPTISATTNRSPGLVPKEWGRNSLPRNARETLLRISPLEKSGKLSENAKRTLDAVLETRGILATGHLGFREAKAVVEFASDIGIRKIIATHPMYGPQGFSLEEMRELSGKCFVEISASMETIDGIPAGELRKVIDYVGTRRCILTSDYGQVKSPDPVSGIFSFARRLGLGGTSLRKLSLENPMKLIKGGKA